MAYATDTSGSERFTMRVRDLASKDELGGRDRRDAGQRRVERGRARLFLHAGERELAAVRREVPPVGQRSGTDVSVYEESDTGFFVSVGLTQSRAFVVVSTADHVTSENYLIPSHAPLSTPAWCRRGKSAACTISTSARARSTS